MLNREAVDAREEELRELAQRLPNSERKGFYRTVSRELKDPDTYAALNWFFLTGLHHFYLGRWQWGCFDLGAFVVGIILIFAQQVWLGLALILAVSVVELWALFRAQLIVQDWNNRIYARHLARHGLHPGRPSGHLQKGLR